MNGAFTAGMMLQAWEHFGDQLRSLSLDIPESGNSVPDFLDEVAVGARLASENAG